MADEEDDWVQCLANYMDEKDDGQSNSVGQSFTTDGDQSCTSDGDGFVCDDGQSYTSAVEEECCSVFSDDEEECADGDIDDLEYLTLDLVNVLPPETWQRLLENLRCREGKAMDMSRENEALKKELSALRSSVRRVPAATVKEDVGTEQPKIAADADSPPIDPSELLLRRELERRASALATKQRVKARLTHEHGDGIRMASGKGFTPELVVNLHELDQRFLAQLLGKSQ